MNPRDSPGRRHFSRGSVLSNARTWRASAEIWAGVNLALNGNIGVPFTVTFTVRNANNTPGTGTFLVSFGNASTGGSKTSSGTLDPGGRFSINMPGAALPGNYPFIVNYKGQQGQVAILRVG